MSGILPAFAATGNTGNYDHIRSLTSGQVWNGSAMESWNIAHWSNYVVAAPEQPGSGCYVANPPVALPADYYQYVLYTPLGGSPASGDTPVFDRDFQFDGTNVIWLGSGLNIAKINGSAQAASDLALSASAMVPGQAAAGTLTTNQMTTNLTNTLANAYAGRILVFTAGGNAGKALLITAYVVTGGMLTMIGYNNQVLATPPLPGDAFIIV
jgi:hypothetical protein